MEPFFARLAEYFASLERALVARAKGASILPNPSDRGASREQTYLKFLERHKPASATVRLGGFLFGMDGSESRQIDLLVSSAHALHFDVDDAEGNGKSFACVDGAIAAVSVKSRLDKKELLDSLGLFESIPQKLPLDGRHSPMLKIKGYDEFPYKIVFSYDGVSASAVMEHLERYYASDGSAPCQCRPNLIHVAGKYSIIRTLGDAVTRDGTAIPANTFHLNPGPSMGWALLHVAGVIQQNAMAASHINYNYRDLENLIPILGL